MMETGPLDNFRAIRMGSEILLYKAPGAFLHPLAPVPTELPSLISKRNCKGCMSAGTVDTPFPVI
jgi:hypothetical protein